METLVGILMFGTLGFFTIFVYLGKRAAEKLADTNFEKSSLSKDGIQERLRARVNG